MGPVIALGLLGMLIVAVSLIGMAIREHHAKRRGHDDADYRCKFWWGDRRESIGAWCRICNPAGQDRLLPRGLR